MIASRKKLGDLCSLVTKGTTPTSVGFDFAERGVPFLRIQNISGSTVSLDDVLYIEESTHNALERSKIRPGDFLITIAGTIGRAAIVPPGFPESNCNQAVAILRFDEAKLWPKFLLYWLSTEDATTQISGRKVTATISNLSLGQIKELEIPLPPLPEQKRIAAILDKADAIRRKRQQAIQLADDFLRAVFLDMFGDPVTNPKGWGTACLEELVKVVSGATPSKSNDAYWTGDFPWVSPKDMKSVEISSSIDHINQVVFERENLKKLPVGSVLIVVRGMILAHTVPVGITTAEVAINQDIKAFVSSGRVLPEFLLWFLLSQHANLLSKVTTAAHGTKRFDMVDLINRPVFVPDMVAQRKFVSIAKSYKTTLAELDWCHKDALQLFNSLSQRAFASQL